MDSSDCCLVSQEIRQLVECGSISGIVDESRIQPSSFEPTIGEDCFILDTQEGLFRPTESQSVWRTLLELPQRRRQKVNISEGLEIKPGASYLFPLNETIRDNGAFRFVGSSPKSSVGRVFPRTRLVTDYNFSFDEITNLPEGSTLNSWLLVQPQAFNLIVGSGLILNQLRFFAGYNAQLTPSQIMGEWEQNPLLFEKDIKGKFGAQQKNPRLADSLQLHLDLEGKSTHGIVALRARKNPSPIDLREKGNLCPEDYFEPMKAKDGRLTLEPGQHYLLASKEVLKIPSNRCAVLRAHSHQGLLGALHEAGFIDNGFIGDLVLEVTPEERTNVDVINGMPIGELSVYRTNVSDKLYGAEIGSHYSGQIGPKVSKYFSSFDFEFAARNHARLDRDVLVQDRILMTPLHDSSSFNFVEEQDRMQKIIGKVEKGFFHSRYDCETDNLVIQPIPYIVLFDEEGNVYSYVRSKNIEDYGDKRLHGKHSIGLGGHITRDDAPNYVANSVAREIQKDVKVEGNLSQPKFIGTLYCSEKEVDRYHFGLVYGVKASGKVEVNDASLSSGRMVSLEGILRDTAKDQKYETWSKVLLPHLSAIRQRVNF